MPCKLRSYIPFTLLIFLCSCTNTFSGSLFFFTFRDMILYVAIAFIIAVLIAFNADAGKGKKAFWIWFILSLVLTPLAGFIYFLVQMTSKNE